MIDEKKLIAAFSENGLHLPEVVKKLIKEQPQTDGWILIEDRMPPDGQKVLLSCKYMMLDYVTVGTIENGNRGKSYIADEDTFMRSGIIAWKPLPEPYKEKHNE